MNVESCEAGVLPTLSTGSSQIKGKWALNHEYPFSCSGKLTNYSLEYYDFTDNSAHWLYIAIWEPVGVNSYKLVRNTDLSMAMLLSTSANNINLSFLID